MSDEFSHKPPVPRKSGIPASVLIPAPESATIEFDFRIRLIACSVSTIIFMVLIIDRGIFPALDFLSSPFKTKKQGKFPLCPSSRYT
jgi:hypothetical protein